MKKKFSANIGKRLALCLALVAGSLSLLALATQTSSTAFAQTQQSLSAEQLYIRSEYPSIWFLADDGTAALIRKRPGSEQGDKAGDLEIFPSAERGVEADVVFFLDADTESFRITSDGTIVAKKVVVTADLRWPDYVFSSKLMPLQEVKKHIDERGVLPGMPSAKEIEEQGGFSLGEMQVKLLEKVEELTLHLIALKADNEGLKERLAALEK